MDDNDSENVTLQEQESPSQRIREVHSLLHRLTTCHSLRRPVLPGGLQHPGLRPVGDEEAVVVREVTVVLHAGASRSVLLQQVSDHLQSFLSGVGSLQSKSVMQEQGMDVLQHRAFC